MSYELTFWRQNAGAELEPLSVYKKLSSGHPVEGVEQLPWRDMLDALGSKFTDGWNRDDQTTWSMKKGGGFIVYVTEQFLRADCYGLSADDLNAIIDVGTSFGCPLFDPQLNERFTVG